jgi:N-methylhydantoinase B/oxoprolinase/acetone carboxylase alpha subunit
MAHGDTRIIPLELQETFLPVRFEEFSLRQDSAGAGKFRGGLGIRKTYQLLEPCSLQTNLDRTHFPPWGTQGGKEGNPGRFTLVCADGSARSIEKEKGFGLRAGDRVYIETGGGGGIESDTLRDPCATYYLARALAVLGHPSAMPMLRRAVEGGFHAFHFFARDPWLDPAHHLLQGREERCRW